MSALAPVSSHLPGFFWFVDVLKFDPAFAAEVQQKQAYLVQDLKRKAEPVLSQWAETQGADIEAVLVKLQRTYKFKRSGYAIHAGAFETVVKAIVPAEVLAAAHIDQEAVDALLALAPTLPAGLEVQESGGEVDSVDAPSGSQVHATTAADGHGDGGSNENSDDCDNNLCTDNLEEDSPSCDQDACPSALSDACDTLHINSSDDSNLCAGGSENSAPSCSQSTPASALPDAPDTPKQHVVTLSFSDVMNRVRRVPDGQFKGYGSVFDVIKLVTLTKNPSVTWARMKPLSPCYESCHSCEIPGSRQQETPVAHVTTLIQIVWDCPGTTARAFRRQCADLIRRVFENDVTLADEIRAGAEASSSQANAPASSMVGATPQPTACTAGTPDSLSAEGGAIVRLSSRPGRTDNAHLGAVPGLESVTLPRRIAVRPGVYLGVKGVFTDTDGIVWAHLKLGKHDYAIDSRIDEHMLENEHWVLLWGAATTNPICTPRMAETKLRIHAKRCRAARVIAGHQCEELLVPLDKLAETADFITGETERVLAEDLYGLIKHNALKGPGEFEPTFDASKYVHQTFQAQQTQHATQQATPPGAPSGPMAFQYASTDSDVAKHALDKQSEVQKAELDTVEKLLRDGVITYDQFLSRRR